MVSPAQNRVCSSRTIWLTTKFADSRTDRLTPKTSVATAERCTSIYATQDPSPAHVSAFLLFYGNKTQPECLLVKAGKFQAFISTVLADFILFSGSNSAEAGYPAFPASDLYCYCF